MPDVSLISLAARLAISMGVVVGLMFLAAKVLRRAQAYAASSGGGSRRGKVTRIPIAVSSVTPLSRNASVAIVRAAGREMVVGITEQHVTLLHSGIEPRDPDDDQMMDLDDLIGQDARAAVAEAEQMLLGLDQQAPTGTARIAAPASTTPTGGGSSAWMDALETLRARTVRR